jgi:serine/threonine-protein kinase HipA
MKCPGCFKEGREQYCVNCRDRLFDGSKIPAILPFDRPKDNNLALFQENTKRLSISGVQLKYSLKREDGKLALTDKNGQYILKPVPTGQLLLPDQAPANEHLTMQIARQVFKIPTAENALIRFADGSPAYITRRFDVQPDKGLKYQQEDFAQLTGRTKKTHGEDFKYNGTYEEIGLLIQKYVAASLPAVEVFFRIVVFNYLFCNGDAHLKNFSVRRTLYGDYGLTPAYDLLCTLLHSPHESDTALDLYKGSMDDEVYNHYGLYTRIHFEELAKRMGILPKRCERIINGLLGKTEEVKKMIAGSFLSEEVKEKYCKHYEERVKRFSMPRVLC